LVENNLFELKQTNKRFAQSNFIQLRFSQDIKRMYEDIDSVSKVWANYNLVINIVVVVG